MDIRALVACFVLASGTIAHAQTHRVPQLAPPSGESPRGPEVVCGTRIFRADANIDPKFVKPAPPGTFTLRAIQPPVCRDRVAAPLSNLKKRLPQILGPKR